MKPDVELVSTHAETSGDQTMIGDIPLVELVSTGSELLDGRSVNTHARLLGESIVPLGLKLSRDTTVPDDAAAIRDAIESALTRVDIVVVSGGLGPTSDDLTRDIISGLTGRRIVMHEPTRQSILAWLAKRGRAPSESMDRHALAIEGADVLANAAGLAPGERIDFNGKTIFLLPGPPSEFRCILNDHLLPWLRLAFRDRAAPLCRSLRLCGTGESEIMTKLKPLGFPAAGIDVAYCARPGDVEIRMLCANLKPLEDSADMVRQVFADAIYSENDGAVTNIEEVTGKLLRASGRTVALAESCTGGLVGHRLTNIGGSSDYFRGGIIAYSNDIKTAQLGVAASTLEQFGAVSEACAKEMAEGARRVFGASIGLATTGIAGPSGGTPEKPVGLVYLAISDERGTIAREIKTGGDREYIKLTSSQLALDFLRRRLQALV